MKPTLHDALGMRATITLHAPGGDQVLTVGITEMEMTSEPTPVYCDWSVYPQTMIHRGPRRFRFSAVECAPPPPKTKAKVAPRGMPAGMSGD